MGRSIHLYRTVFQVIFFCILGKTIVNIISIRSLLKTIFHIEQESTGFLKIACIFFTCCLGLLKLWIFDYTGKSCSWLTYIGHAHRWLQAFVPTVGEGMNKGIVTDRTKLLRKSKNEKNEVSSLQNHIHKFVSYILCSLHWSQWECRVQLCKDQLIYKSLQDWSSHLWFKPKMRSLKEIQQF